MAKQYCKGRQSTSASPRDSVNYSPVPVNLENPVARVPAAEMTESLLIPRDREAGMTGFSLVPRVPGGEVIYYSLVPTV